MTLYNLDPRCKDILDMLLQAPTFVSVQDIMATKNISRRSVYYDINKINEWLEAIGIEPIEVERSKGILINEEKRKVVKKQLLSMTRSINYVFSPMERVSVIICTTLMKTKQLHIEDYMEIVQVSRNTIINDLKMVAKKMVEYELSFGYENKRGYHILGSERNKRMVFFLYFNEISEFYSKNIIAVEKVERADEILVKLYEIESKLQTDYVRGICLSIAIYFSSIESRGTHLEFSEEEEKEIKETKEYQLVSEKFVYMHDSERLYMTLHLLGSRVQTISFSEFNKDDEIYEITRSLIHEFSRVSCIDFESTEELEKALFQHLKTSIYRYRYGIQLGNPLLEDIKREYRDLFAIVSKTCEYLEQRLSLPIPESEIAYITLHFGGFIHAQRKEKKDISILIVCPNGVSTGNMLRHEVTTLIARTSSVTVISLSEYDFNHNYDVVISIVEIHDKNHEVLKVHPILSDNDRLMILKRCINVESEQQVRMEEVLTIVSKYVNKEELTYVKEDLKHYFNAVGTNDFLRVKQKGISLITALGREQVAVHKEKVSWQQSIHIASRILLQDGAIEERYIENIIQKNIDLGPYMFITNEVVLAHAKVEDGVNRLGISMTLFKEPVVFEKNKIARIVIVLAAPDQYKHIRILKDIMTIFRIQQHIDELLVCKNQVEVYELLNIIIKKEELNENE